MARKKDDGGESEAFPRTNMRSPFTAETPDEYDDAEWIPNLRSWPDVSEDDSSGYDPMGFVPGMRKNRGK